MTKNKNMATQAEEPHECFQCSHIMINYFNLFKFFHLCVYMYSKFRTYLAKILKLNYQIIFDILV